MNAKKIKELIETANGNIEYLINKIIFLERNATRTNCCIEDIETRKICCKKYQDCNKCQDDYFEIKRNEMLENFKV